MTSIVHGPAARGDAWESLSNGALPPARDEIGRRRDLWYRLRKTRFCDHFEGSSVPSCIRPLQETSLSILAAEPVLRIGGVCISRDGTEQLPAVINSGFGALFDRRLLSQATWLFSLGKSTLNKQDRHNKR